MRGILIDLDGVLYQGDEAIPGAAAVLEWLKESRIPQLFVTNTTSRPRRAICKKLASMGIEADEDRILTPVVAASCWLKRQVSGPAALFMPSATMEEFENIPQLPAHQESGAAAVVLGDLGEGWDFPRLNRAFRLLMDSPQPPLIALGMTRYWRAEDGLRLDVAPFVKALEHAAACEAIVLGKPSKAFFQEALKMLGVDAEDTIMIGDDICGDVKGAQDAGLRGILVRTGKFLPSDLDGSTHPDAVLESISDLPAWWEQNSP
ncbi:MAG: TIGR01458 family HAD-type hydrolase [Proteobacteria bacterium]|nr:TIGR01458 family HAD-type hydrolase [Pseudomonadota bacterium]